MRLRVGPARRSPTRPGMLKRLKDRGLRICVWINPYIAQRSPLFAEGARQRLPGPPGRRRRLAVGPVAGRHGPGRLHQPGGPRSGTRTSCAACSTWASTRSRPTSASASPPTWSGTTAPTRSGCTTTTPHLYNQARLRRAARAPRRGRGGAVRPLGHRRRPAVPGALGRRLRVDVRVDGREPARRAVAGDVRLRLLEPRHRRLRGPAATRPSSSAGCRSACSPRTAGCTAARPTGCRGSSTTRRSTCCGRSPGSRHRLMPYLFGAARWSRTARACR